MMSPQARVIQDYAWLEENIGPLIPVEVILKVPVPDGDRQYEAIFERLTLADRVREELESIDGLDVATSAATYMPPLPQGRGGLATVKRSTIKAMLKDPEKPENRERLKQLQMFVEATDVELWRVSSRVNAGQAVDYGTLIAEVHRRLPPLFRQAEEEGIPGVTAVVTGGVPVVHKAQDQLLRDLIISFACAFGLIAVAMIVLFTLSAKEPALAESIRAANRPDGVIVASRNIVAGLLCMIPNLLPALMVFGAMGLIGIQIEVGTMLTASAALGIAVDDTLHYVTWFRRGLSQGMDKRQAIEFAYRRCGNAMIQTSAICGFGLLVFSLSPFGPISRFGWMMCSMLAAALVGDLVVLPAILVGPLGRMFRPYEVTPPATEPAPKTDTVDSAVVHS
jgi:predicted RND superfamily exporter protein